MTARQHARKPTRRIRAEERAERRKAARGSSGRVRRSAVDAPSGVDAAAGPVGPAAPVGVAAAVEAAAPVEPADPVEAVAVDGGVAGAGDLDLSRTQETPAVAVLPAAPPLLPSPVAPDVDGASAPRAAGPSPSADGVLPSPSAAAAPAAPDRASGAGDARSSSNGKLADRGRPAPTTRRQAREQREERKRAEEARQAARKLDARRTLRTLGISVNPPPPPERPARFGTAKVTYPSSATIRDRNGVERAAHVKRGKRRPPAPESIPPLPAPVVGDLPVPVRPLRPGIYAPPPGHRRSGPPNYFLRRLGVIVGLVAIGGVSFASYSVATPGPAKHVATRVVAGRSATAAGPAGAPAPAPRPTWFVLPKRPEPGGGTTLFPSHRLVAYYGVSDNPALGVLGDAPPDVLWPRLSATAAPYDAPGTTVVPSYELIAFTAEAAPGPDGTYTQALPASTIEQYRQVVDARGGMLILDIQPGRSNFLDDAKTLAPWLTDPHVGLALDPEWELQPGQLPARQVGHTTAAEINQVSAWLQQLTTANDLPQKLLLIHQFQTQMIRDKQDVAKEPDLAIAFNMDGFGPSENKLSVYNLVASDPRFALGYKLFYTRDTPLQTPQDVLGLQPVPSIIEYE